MKKLLLILIPSIAMADCSLMDVLPQIRPGATWVLQGSDYSGLSWIDQIQTKPSIDEVQAGQTACLAALTPAGILAGQRAAAISELNTGTQPLTKLERAILLLLFDENNILRQRDVDRSADVAAATSLADLKVRWAARSALDQRTIAQFKTAVQNKINSGAAD